MAHFWLQVLPEPVGPNDPDPRIALERAWMQNRLRKSPEDQIALYNLAAIATQSGDNTQAETLYRRILAHNPTGSDAARTSTSLAAAMVASGNWQGGIEQFRAALQLDPTYTDAAFDLAAQDIEHASDLPDPQAALTEAETQLNTLATAHPEDPAIQRLYALLCIQQGLPIKAVDHLRTWQRLAPKDAEPHRALAQVYMQMGQVTDALREQNAVIFLATTDTKQLASDWSDLGVMEAQAGHKLAAKRDFTHALELDPSLEAAKANLSKL
jgi:Flp pilus assembly protein TadD